MTEKIQDLMRKCGLSEAAAAQICTAIDVHLESRDKQLKAEHDSRLDEAKKVCVEEVESYKRELARRLQIFCEAKGEAIERSVAKQTAIKESAAYAKLRDIQTLLAGVELNGGSNGALQADYTKLKRQLQGLSEERNQAVETANRANAIAGKVLKRNRLLESQVKRTPAVNEQRAQQPKGNGKPIARQGTQPTTTRATLVENQERRPVPQRQTQTNGEYTPETIAALLVD